MSANHATSVAEFVDEMAAHRQGQEAGLGPALPEELSGLAAEAGRRTREELGLPPNGLVILLGEQTYGPGPQKVLGKRLLGNAASRYAGVAVIEFFASQDTLGSEPDITNFKLPNPQPAAGVTPINMLPNWRRSADKATAAVASPPPDHVAKISQTISDLYPRKAAGPFAQRIRDAYERNPASYGAANADILREYEQQLGIAGTVMIQDGQLETLLAKHGGMQVIMGLWPAFVAAARNHAVDGVRIPEAEEAPFYVYHEDCGGRMNVRTLSPDPLSARLETQVAAECLHCRHQESLTLHEIISSGRTLTFRAMARVAAFSLFGLVDGHVTGGGSIYNVPTEEALRELGLPYHPLIHMSKVDAEGQPSAIFQYESGTTTRKSASTLAGYDEARRLVREGQVSVADLEISTSPDAVRAGIAAAMEHSGEFTIYSRVTVEQNREGRDGS